MDVAPSLIAEWRDDRLRNERRSPATVEAQQRVVIAFMRFLTQAGVSPEFPPHIRVKTPKKPNRRPRWLSDRDADRLLRVAEERGPREAALVSLLMLAGLRIGEALRLRKDDVQIHKDAASWVTIRAALGKGMRERRVPLPRRGRDNLILWLAEVNGDHFFPGRGGGVLTARAALKMIDGLKRRVGIAETVSPHQLRHTFAHRLVAKGVQLDQVADLMGHSSLETTRRYTVASLEELARDVAMAWE